MEALLLAIFFFVVLPLLLGVVFAGIIKYLKLH
jgi:hypothetical protein